jgi:hypothetical protein
MCHVEILTTAGWETFAFDEERNPITFTTLDSALAFLVKSHRESLEAVKDGLLLDAIPLSELSVVCGPPDNLVRIWADEVGDIADAKPIQ